MSAIIQEVMTHWCSEPFELESRIYEQKLDWKPKGFWFDVDEDWHRWCEGESFDIEGRKHRYHINIKNPSEILVIAGAHNLDGFTAKYGVERYPDHPSLHGINIDWPRVAERYRGIIIAPYCWERRMELMWYYGWDCASGVVWDTSAIELLTPAKRKAEK